MIGDLEQHQFDCGGLGMRAEADPIQIADLKNETIYIFGESTIEVEVPEGAIESSPFVRPDFVITGE
jgi:hypothetical protein